MTELKTTWWNSPARNSVYARWTFLVLINTLFPMLFAFGVLQTPSHFIGMLLAIASFVVLYSELDHYLIRSQRLQLSKRLRISAAIKTATPLLPFIDMICGAISLAVTEAITGQSLESRFESQQHDSQAIIEASSSLQFAIDASLAYLTTMINGFVLSGIVALILGLISIIARLRSKRQSMPM